MTSTPPAPVDGPSPAVRASRAGASEASSAVSVRGVVKSFGATRAVAGLDLDLPRGSVLALIGPNGAGKTTTVELCEGFTTPDAGSVRVLGLDPVADSGRLRPRIGVMLQGGGAYPAARAGEMLRLVASYSARPIDPDWLLTTLGLTTAVDTPYRRLSGGQQQRLSLACALVNRPEMVFLDEPTAGLDTQTRLLVWDLVDALRRDGVSVLLTTHLMDEAEQLADRVVIVDGGTAVASGTVAELTRDGAEEQLRFSAPSGLDTALLAAVLPEGYQVSEAPTGSYVVQGRITPQVLATVTSWCARLDVLAADLRVARRSLEDLFLELTGRQMRP